ncbi:MAG: FtsX-like permease family protein [Gemmatimonadetes bacterium]|nr:ABC transporter permease [Gemmatimonadota bacterium]NIQ59876.1 ABC transporter permease [Gemmatimonadota bacterium]NIU80077.1 FtsX-like permease family protein [Gammaproteobacteria bacterium]NIX48496.1 FtsX-like permease family protein [Gemmatimonadota bacterium]NIY12943.1 FtsX-like permease family protein [Gemmatimonadota bacterium]
MFRLLLAEFWTDLKAQRTRALLTLFAVFWGTLTIVLLLSFGEGLKRAVVEGLIGAGSRMYMVYGGETTEPFEGLPGGRRIRLVEQDLDLLMRSIPQIDRGSVSYGRYATLLESEALTTTTMMEGVHPDFSDLRSMFPVDGGRFLNDRDMAERRRVIFLGDSIATRLFPAGGAVGGTVKIDGLPFTVVGTMATKAQSGMNNGPDADRAIIPASTLRTIYGPTRVSHILVRPRDIREAARVKRRLYEVLGAKYSFDPDDTRALRMWDFIEDERMSRNIGLGIQIFLGVVGALTLIVAGVGVANIMYVVVRERTREIGVKLAVGARRRHIMAQFVFEAILICSTGGLAGLLLGGSIVTLVARLPDTNEAMFYIANPTLSWPITLATVAILMGIGILAGVFPARRAAALDPVESLRYE